MCMQVSCNQDVSWLAPCLLPTLTEEDLQGWFSTGKVMTHWRELLVAITFV